MGINYSGRRLFYDRDHNYFGRYENCWSMDEGALGRASPADYEAASKRIEAAGRAGNKQWKTKEVVEGRKILRAHSGRCSFLRVSSVGWWAWYLTRC